MGKPTGPLEPPQYIGERLITYEDLDALCERPSGELHRQLTEGGAMKLTSPPLNREEVISAARILYARLLAGLIPPQDTNEIERTLTRLIDGGLWPWYKSDLKCIRLAIRGCGFMPGYPLRKDATQSNEQARAS